MFKYYFLVSFMGKWIVNETLRDCLDNEKINENGCEKREKNRRM